MAGSKKKSQRRAHRPPASRVRGAAVPASPGGADQGGSGGAADQGLGAHAVVTSNMGWRIMAFVVLLFLGLTVTFLTDGHVVYGVLWLLVTAAWGFFAFKLYRRHTQYVDSL